MRPAHVVFLLVVVALTIALAYWQWTRFRSGSGTFQNLGYAIQWPFFGLFAVYAYRSFIRYEQEVEETGEAPVAREQRQREERGEVRSIDAGVLPKRRRVSVEEFNRLNERRRGGGDVSGVLGEE